MEQVTNMMVEKFSDVDHGISFKDYFDGVDDCIRVLEDLENSGNT